MYNIAQIDLDRLELQRVQYESDLETADVNLRTAKITLLTLLNDRTPIDKYDVSETFDFSELLMSRDEFRKIALDNRPDLKAALQAVDKAQTDHKLGVANGSTDRPLALMQGATLPSINMSASTSAFHCGSSIAIKARSGVLFFTKTRMN